MTNRTLAELFAAGLFTGVAFAQPTALAPPKSVAPVNPKVAECRARNQAEH